MSRAAYGLIKGMIIGITLVGAAYIFKQTMPLPVEVVKNFKLLLTGQYSVPHIGDTFFYTFNGYATVMAIAFNLIPSASEIADG